MQWDCIDMKGLVVLITGSSSGIGRETAYRFAQTGAKIILTYNKGKARGEQAEKRCLRLGAESTLLLHLLTGVKMSTTSGCL